MGALPPLPKKYKAIAVCGVAVLASVVVSAVYGGRGWMHLQELDVKQHALENLAFRLQQENHKRQEHLERLKTDDRYVEKLAREQLGWIKPGETVYRVRGVTASDPLPVAKSASESVPVHKPAPRQSRPRR